MSIYASQVCVRRECLCKDTGISAIHVQVLPVFCHSADTTVSRRVGDSLGQARGATGW